MIACSVSSLAAGIKYDPIRQGRHLTSRLYPLTAFIYRLTAFRMILYLSILTANQTIDSLFLLLIERHLPNTIEALVQFQVAYPTQPTNSWLFPEIFYVQNLKISLILRQCWTVLRQQIVVTGRLGHKVRRRGIQRSVYKSR